MSGARGLFPMALATVIGIGTGMAIFQPAFKDEKEQREQAEYSIGLQSQNSVLILH